MTSSGSAEETGPPGLVEIGRRWADAVARRDADALVEITDPDIAFYPAKVLHDRALYRGHDGLRQWIADVAAAHAPITERITDVRPGHPGHVVALGDLVVCGRPTSPFSLLMSLRADKVAEARAYLSDEAQLRRIGRLPAPASGPRSRHAATRLEPSAALRGSPAWRGFPRAAAAGPPVGGSAIDD